MRILEAVRRRVVTQETRAKLNARMTGKHLTEAAKLKNRLAHLGKKPTAEASEKAAQKNRRYTVENGQIVSKTCRVHGVVLAANCIIKRHANGVVRVFCGICKSKSKVV